MGKLLRSRYFRRHFFSFFLLITVIIAGLTAILFFPTRRSLERQQLLLVEKYRDEVVTSLDNWVRYARREIEVGSLFVSEYLAAGRASSRDLTAVLEAMAESDGALFVDLLLTDSEGRLINSRVHSDEIKPVNLADRDYIRNGLEGRSTVSGYFRSRNTGSPILVVASPVYTEDEIAGVLAGIVRLESLADVFNSISLGAMGMKYLVDDEGYVVSKAGFTEAFIANNREALDTDFKAAETVMQKISGTMVETCRYTGTDGKDVFGSYARLDPLNLGVAVEVKGDMTLRPIYTLIKIILLSGGFFFLASGIIVYGMTYNFLNPINRLVTFTRHMVEEGKTDAIDMTTGSELDTLIENFNIMNSIIRLRERQLKDLAMRDSLTGLYNH
ncbi:MAG: cache domain-containing protein, partial [bacterium]